MPELPEVEALAAALAPRAEGLVVARFDVAAINALKTFAPPATATLGSAVLGFSRRGKHLIIDLADPDGEPLAVVIHLGRAGWVRWRDDPPPARRTPPRAAGLAVRISLAPDAGAGGSGAGRSGAGDSGAGTADGRAPVAAIDVTEAGTQKRLAVHIVRDPQDVPRVASLGPEPLSEEFDLPTLEAILDAAGRSQIKGVLRDQARIAGIGNAYSDEILHRSRLSPFAPAAALGPQERSTLLASMKDLLSQAVTAAVASDPASLKAEKKASMAVHGRTGLPCPVCGDTIREVSFADSSLQYCPTCQTGGRILADRRMSRLLK